MINQFVDELAHKKSTNVVFNPYAHGRPENKGRRHNLRQYLALMADRSPAILLVGEAPGYRGCRLTGIPFTSPAILKNGILFTNKAGFHHNIEWPHIRNEATATIFWSAMTARRRLPLLWNAFPFHPHHLGQSQSNRTPTKRELIAGEIYIHKLMAIYPIEKVAAVGNKAAETLAKWGIPHDKIRHPSHGGKHAFLAGLDALNVG